MSIDYNGKPMQNCGLLFSSKVKQILAEGKIIIRGGWNTDYYDWADLL